jgi:arsenite-transporting ATPase
LSAHALIDLFREPTRHLFFTGKGGVGKTSLACATAIALADLGKRVLLVSTDPASNLDEVLGVALGPSPTSVPSVQGLEALNIDPDAAARAYRERIVGPYRGKLPDSAVVSIEEQLSGACTVEIAAFDEFAKLLGDAATTSAFDHVVFDTAPTGHTLRLLSLPAAWTGYLVQNPGAASCLGPLGGLQAQRQLYEATVRALSDASATTLVLVTRPEAAALNEAQRTHVELDALGVGNQRLIVNGTFEAGNRDDRIALALEARARAALAAMPADLAGLDRITVPLAARSLVGVAALRQLLYGGDESALASPPRPLSDRAALEALIADLEKPGRGVIMTMGKGGVGKTTIAAALATELARRGHRVHLTTTDPAAHVAAEVGAPAPNLTVSRIDPAAETQVYMSEVRRLTASALDEAGRALLEEDLRSPCTEEVAVFRAFARTVAGGEDGFVVVDTAPTGHTLLLLDATETYHREVSRGLGDAPDAVRRLLPRLRDPGFTRILVVTLPDATPVHEAMRLDADLRRADIQPFAWLVNQSLAACETTDPVLSARAAHEWSFIDEVGRATERRVVVPWTDAPGDMMRWRA